jgi:predicted DNA-binding transcriptional regulator AlpA
MKLKTAKTILTEEEKLVAAKNRAAVKKAAVNEVVQKFGSLPDQAYVRQPVVMELYAFSAASLWRGVQKGTVPSPRKFGPRVTAWNVGKLKASLAA